MIKIINGTAVITVLLSALLSTTVRAATVNAASCNQSDVLAAVSSANDGDTVIFLPAL